MGLDGPKILVVGLPVSIQGKVRVKSVVARRICTSANPIKLIYLIDIRRKNDQLSKLELLGNPTMNLADREATPVGQAHQHSILQPMQPEMTPPSSIVSRVSYETTNLRSILGMCVYTISEVILLPSHKN